MLKKIILISLLVLIFSGISFVAGVVAGGYGALHVMPYVNTYQKMAADGTLNKVISETNKDKEQR